MICEVGQLSRPDGDVKLMQGDTVVTTGIYGPGEVRITKEILDKATVEVIYKPKSGLPGCADKMFERTIRNTCETVLLTALHPRSSITIVIQEMQNSGSFLSCCVNASCLALLDASVSMKYLVAAVTCAINEDSKLLIDPSDKEEKQSLASLTFVFDNKDSSVITVSTKGSYTVDQFHMCLEACRLASKSIFEFYKLTMEKKLSKSV